MSILLTLKKRIKIISKKTKLQSKKGIRFISLLAIDNLNKTYKYVKFQAIPFLNQKTEEINNNLIKEDGREFWNVLSSSRLWSRRIIWTLVSVSTFGIIFASVAYVDESVQTTGKLEPKGKTLKIKVPLGGVIEDILIEEGQLVKKNQVLLRLDTTAVKAKLKALELVKEQINADILISKFQLGNKQNGIKLTPNQQIRLNSVSNEYISRINAAKSSVEQINYQKESIQEQINSQEEVLKIREDILINLESLIEIGGLSKVKYLKEKQEIIQIKGAIASQKAELNKIIESLNEAKSRLNNTIEATKIDFSTKIEENTKQIAQINNQISESKLTLKYQSIKSPLDGVVFDLKPEAPGFVVNTQEPILKIVPTDDVVARVFISNKDIAFIKEKQKVKIRLDAYPSNEFGELEGEIDSIGSDVLEPDENFNYYRFPVTVSLRKPFIEHKGKKLPLITGMSLSANIILRQRPVISIFTERILPFWDSLEKL